MIDPADVPPVSSNETVARFVLQNSQVRADGSVKPDVFIPPGHRRYSVNRLLQATEEETWTCGKAVASSQNKPLVGRVDFGVERVLKQHLTIDPAPIEGNPNHANVLGWPDKPLQKALATVLSTGIFITRPPAAPPS